MSICVAFVKQTGSQTKKLRIILLYEKLVHIIKIEQ
jgi:hypothetical protein